MPLIKDLDSARNRAAFLVGGATLNFGNDATQTSEDLSVTVPGAAVGDIALVAPPAAPDANTCYTAYVSAEDTVKVRFNNYSGGSVNPASGAFIVLVIKTS
jgi:hypothetical protein